MQVALARPRPAPRMRAAVLAAPGRFEVREVQRPDPRPGEVRLRLEGSGICGSNLPPWEGRPWFGYPFGPGAPGHEGWGVIDAVGADVRGLAEGDRVASLGLASFAEHEVVPAAHVAKLPAALDGRPCPGEPLACAVNAFRRSQVTSGQSVAVVGVGFLGALLVRLASAAGARVVALGRRPFALGVARTMGAAEAIALRELTSTRDAALAANAGVPFDRVIEATGAQGALDLATELTRERGTLVIAGYHQDGLRTVNLQLWNWRGLDVVNAHERDPAVYVDGMRRAIDALAGGVLDPTPLYTHRYTLDHLDQALEAVRRRPEGFMKALVTP